MDTQFLFAKVKAINEQARTLDAVASTSDRDRHGDVVLPSAFKDTLPTFAANPVILAGHQHRLSDGRSPVIGSAVPESIRILDNEVVFTMRFAETELGSEYWQLYKDGHMKAFSIGFIPLKWVDSKETDTYTRTYTEIELLEISAVPVPSNRRALARVRGYFDHESEDAGNLAKTISQEISKLEKKLTEQIDELKCVIGDSDGYARGLLDGDHDLSGDDANKETVEQRVLKMIQNLNKK